MVVSYDDFCGPLKRDGPAAWWRRTTPATPERRSSGFRFRRDPSLNIQRGLTAVDFAMRGNRKDSVDLLKPRFAGHSAASQVK